MRYLYIFLSLLSLSLFGTLIGVPQAQAQSVYDDILIEQTYPFNLESPYNSSTMAVNSKSEISNIFANAHFESSYSCTVEEFIRIYGLTSDSPYIVTSNYQNSGKKSIYLLVFNQEPVYNWSPDGLQFLKQDYHRIILNSHSSSQASAIECSTYYDDWGAGMIYGDKSYTADRVIEYGNFVFDYPSGYAGQIIEPTESNEVISTSPDWYISDIIDWKGTFHDSNFNTFDGNPFLCDDEFAPVLHWELWLDPHGGPQTLKASGVQSATAEINHQFEKVDIISRYEIVGWYECPGYEFPNQGRKKFEIGRNGLLEQNLFETCIDFTQFLFINPENCLSNVYTVINLLSFNQISLGNVWQLSDGCRNLGVVGDWMFTPNHRICPQFPAEIRNILTPFITVALGLLTISFIARKREE